MSASLLLSYFQPFDGHSLNSSQLVAQKVLENCDHKIESIELPVVFDQCWAPLEAKIEECKPDYVIALGQAEGRKEVTIERVALNIIDARIPDNQGYQPKDQQVSEGGPRAYFSTLPTRDLVEVSKNHDTPTALSYTAGTYICNYILYKLLELTEGTQTQAGFIHLPITSSQKKNEKTHSLEVEQMYPGILGIVNYLITS